MSFNISNFLEGIDIGEMAQVSVCDNAPVTYVDTDISVGAVETLAVGDVLPVAIADPKIVRKIFSTGEFNQPTSTPLKKRKYKENVAPYSSTSEMSDSTKLDILLSSFERMEQNQKVLADNQMIVMSHILDLKSNMLTKEDGMAETKVLREVKVMTSKMEREICKVTGESTDLLIREVASFIPIASLITLLEVEEKLEDEAFCQAMTTYCYKVKGAEEHATNLIKKVFSDEVLVQFNWVGIGGKRAFRTLNLVVKVLQNIFKSTSAVSFEEAAKRALNLSHHRVLQQKDKKTKKVETLTAPPK